jgi:REP element-mobilizing transposase RayT
MKWKNFYQPNTVYLFSSRITEKIYILRKPVYKQIVADALQKYLTQYQTRLHGYVIMDNHFHLLLSAPEALGLQRCLQQTLRQSASDIIRSLRGYLDSSYARQAEEILPIFARHANGKSKYAVWKEQARGIALSTYQSFEVRLRYVHENPVRAGLVSATADYAFSSFRTLYYGVPGLLPVTFPEMWWLLGLFTVSGIRFAHSRNRARAIYSFGNSLRSFPKQG